MRILTLVTFLAITGLTFLGCSSSGSDTPKAEKETPAPASRQAQLPGMPPVIDPNDIYSEDHVGKLSDVVKDLPERVYVPNSASDTVDIIDPKTYKIIGHFAVGKQPQHVVPSWDLKILWVLNDKGDSLTRIDPKTAEKGETIKVLDPYNMYYTPDGKFAMVVSEARRELNFHDAQTMKLVETLKVPCRGVDHMDFSSNGFYLIASCEFSAQMIKVDVAARKVIGTLHIDRGGMPQDVKLSPDGKVFYVADMEADGVHMIDGDSFKEIGFVPTGKGAHGLYASRDSKVLYVSNRGEGSISLIDFATRKVSAKWQLPGGGSPDMGGVSADGKVLWLAGRYNAEVYAIDTAEGKLLARIPVGKGPHGLCFYPQPGRYSLGHTGVFR
jgi:YVTN family beta-propeller protein